MNLRTIIPLREHKGLSSTVNSRTPLVIRLLVACLTWVAVEVGQPCATAASPLSIVLNPSAVDVWSGEWVSVTPSLEGEDAYWHGIWEIEWSISGSAGATGEWLSGWGYNYYYITVDPAASGTITVTATLGGVTATCDINVHRVTGITATPGDVVAYDAPVTFSAVIAGGANPVSPPSWSGPVIGNGPDYVTAQSDWTTGGYKNVVVSGGSSSATKQIKAIQLVIEAFPKHEPVKVGELSGFDVLVNGALGETPTFTWSGAVSGSSAAVAFTPTTPGGHPASVDVTVAGVTMNSTAVMQAIDLVVSFFVGETDYGLVATVSGSMPSGSYVEYEIEVNDILKESGVFSDSLSCLYQVSAFTSESAWEESATVSTMFNLVEELAKLEEMVRAAFRVPVIIWEKIGELDGIIFPPPPPPAEPPVVIQYKQASSEVVQWLASKELYSTEPAGLHSPPANEDSHNIKVFWRDPDTFASKFTEVPASLKVEITLGGTKVKKTSDDTLVGFFGLEANVKQSFTPDYKPQFTYGPMNEFSGKLIGNDQSVTFTGTARFENTVTTWAPGNLDVSTKFTAGIRSGTTVRTDFSGFIGLIPYAWVGPEIQTGIDSRSEFSQSVTAQLP